MQSQHLSGGDVACKASQNLVLEQCFLVLQPYRSGQSRATYRQGMAQQLNMVKAQGGDAAHNRLGNAVGGVQSPTHTHF